MGGEVLNECGGRAWLDDVADFNCAADGYGGVPGFGGERVFRGRGAARKFRIPDAGDFSGRVELHFPSTDGAGGGIFQKNLHLRSRSPVTDELLGDGEHRRCRSGVWARRWRRAW